MLRQSLLHAPRYCVLNDERINENINDFIPPNGIEPTTVSSTKHLYHFATTISTFRLKLKHRVLRSGTQRRAAWKYYDRNELIYPLCYLPNLEQNIAIQNLQWQIIIEITKFIIYFTKCFSNLIYYGKITLWLNFYYVFYGFATFCEASDCERDGRGLNSHSGK